jgi:DNA topoisomerase-2
LLRELEQELMVLTNKSQYISDTLENKIDLRNKTKEQVQQIMSKFAQVEKSHNYLTKMPMDSVTGENVAKIFKEKKLKEEQLDILTKTTENQMWNSELDELRKELSNDNSNLKKSVKKLKIV